MFFDWDFICRMYFENPSDFKVCVLGSMANIYFLILKIALIGLLFLFTKFLWNGRELIKFYIFEKLLMKKRNKKYD